MIQTSKETVILRNQSKTCIYVRVEVDLEGSWRRLGGLQGAVWRRLGASGRGRGASRRRLVKQTRPNGSCEARESAAPERTGAQRSAPERNRAPLRSDQRLKVYLSG